MAEHLAVPIDQRRVWKTAEVIAFEVVNDIVARGLRAGDHLPSEAEMINYYGVSRGSLREALRLLEAQGMVTIRRGPGGGPIVGTAESANLARTMTLYFHLGGATYEELFQAWRTMEPAVAGLAAENPDRHEVQRLMSPHLDRFDDCGARDAYIEHSNGLHFSIAALSGNRVLNLVLGAVGDIIRTHVLPQLDPFDLREMIDTDHEEIAGAVLAGRADDARRAMAEHNDRLDPIYRAHWQDGLRAPITWK